MGIHKYKNDDITVTWDSEVCVHSEVCRNNLETVFNPDKRPWVNVDAETRERIMEVIDKCPSGALQYMVEDSGKPASEENQITITLADHGPLLVNGPVQLVDAAGDRIETKQKFALCRCGHSENKPFCYGTHKKVGFEG